MKYILYAFLLFAGLGLLNQALNELDPCYESHSDWCVEQPDYKGD